MTLDQHLAALAPDSTASDVLGMLADPARQPESTDLLARRLRDDAIIATDRACHRAPDMRAKAYNNLIRTAAMAIALADRIRAAEAAAPEPPPSPCAREPRHHVTPQETFADLERKGLA